MNSELACELNIESPALGHLTGTHALKRFFAFDHQNTLSPDR